jgi:hypothetical protein
MSRVRSYGKTEMMKRLGYYTTNMKSMKERKKRNEGMKGRRRKDLYYFPWPIKRISLPLLVICQ